MDELLLFIKEIFVLSDRDLNYYRVYTNRFIPIVSRCRGEIRSAVVAMKQSSDLMTIVFVGTKQEHRNKGLATQNLNELLQKYGRKYSMFLAIDKGKPNSAELIRWYAKFGFRQQEAGNVPRYYCMERPRDP